MMAVERHQTWENFQTAVLGPGGVHPIPGVPQAWVFAERGGTRIGIRIGVPHAVEVPACLVAALELRLMAFDGVPCLELTCRHSDLNRQFYSLVLDVADAIQILGQSPGNALAAAVAQWEQLLRVRRILTADQQVGLFGELWLLRRLITARGAPALDAWMGPAGEPHDFRWDDLDVEVKTTTQAVRSHVINRLGQLESAPDRRLYILSLLIQPAGGAPGTSLADAVADARARLANPEAIGRFNLTLTGLGYRDEDEPFYRRAWCMRAAAALVPVDEGCPRLTRPHVDTMLGVVASRIDDVHYRVNLDGLGWLDPDPRFTAVIA